MSIGTLPELPLSYLPAPPVQWDSPDAPGLRRVTVDEYDSMIEAGILHEGESVELVAGLVINKTPSSAGEPTVRRWTADEYQKMIEIGVLQESERIELLEGWIVHKMPSNTPHDTALQKCQKRIRAVLPSGWDLREQKAVAIGGSLPEPDCAIVAGDEDSYLQSKPEAADIAFLVEVADSSPYIDRKLKVGLYARASIAVYWIVNLIDRQVEVYSNPTGVTDPPEAAGYRTTQVYREADSVPVVIGGQTVAQLHVVELLPRA